MGYLTGNKSYVGKPRCDPHACAVVSRLELSNQSIDCKIPVRSRNSLQ